VEATAADTMLRALDLARGKLNYVFLGNVGLEDGSDSLCAECGNLMIERDGYKTNVVGLDGTRCAGCNEETGIVR
jgi:pyruvate formate lyase activating enzyme